MKRLCLRFTLRPRSCAEPHGDQLACVWPHICCVRYRHNDRGQSTVQQREETLRTGARDQNV